MGQSSTFELTISRSFTMVVCVNTWNYCAKGGRAWGRGYVNNMLLLNKGKDGTVMFCTVSYRLGTSERNFVEKAQETSFVLYACTIHMYIHEQWICSWNVYIYIETDTPTQHYMCNPYFYIYGIRSLYLHVPIHLLHAQAI